MKNTVEAFSFLEMFVVDEAMKYYEVGNMDYYRKVIRAARLVFPSIARDYTDDGEFVG